MSLLWFATRSTPYCYLTDMGAYIESLHESTERIKCKKTFSDEIIKNIGLASSDFKLAWGKMGQKIVTYNLLLNSGKTKQEIYEQIRVNDPNLLEYLTIRSAEKIDKLGEYVNNL